MAVAGIEAGIADALLWQAGQVAAQVGLQIAYPSVSFTPANGTPYLTATFRPNIANALAIGFSGDTDRQGLLQMSVFWPAGAGEIAAQQIASQIAAAFKYGTDIVRNGVRVRILQTPRVAPSLQETDWLQVPVMIAWRCLTPAIS